jgi:putative ABC transport system permease protein
MFTSNRKRGVRPHLWLIRIIGVIVPRRLRADWRQEWEAELRHREALLAEWDRLDWRHKLDLLQRSTSAFWDALWLQPKRWEDEMIQDFRFGIRMLLKNPSFTVVAVLALALGIGANTAIFSVVDAVLLRPLPYRDAARLVSIYEANLERKVDHMMISLADFHEWKNQNRSFADMAAHANRGFRVTGGAFAEQVPGAQVSVNFFSFLGVQAAIGRVFLPDDERPNAQPVAVLSHQYWATHFGSSPNVIGQTITLTDKPHVIVGVLPADFRQAFESHPGRAMIWTPAALTDEEMRRHGPAGHMALARLNQGVSLEQARAEMRTIAERLAQAYPATNKGISAAVFSLNEDVTRNTRGSLFTLLAAFGLVLLIACANVASLLLARGVERAKEIAIRAAIGAGRRRIVRQLLTESALLALLGAGGAFLLAKWMLAAVIPLIPPNVPRTDEIALDHRVMLFTMAAALFSSLLCGLLPAMQASKIDLTEMLKDSGQTASADRRSRWWRGSLIVWQVALTTVLLVGAGLLINSLIRLYRTDPGLDTRNLVTMQIRLARGGGDTSQQWSEFWNQLHERARNLPGAQGAALVVPLPLGGSVYNTTVGFSSSTTVSPNEAVKVNYYTVSHDYFRMLGIRLVRGRYFTDDDKAGSQPVVIVNEGLARSYFPGREAVGQNLIVDRGTKYQRTALIAGVVIDSRVKLDVPATPSLYLSMTQFPVPSTHLLVRTATDPAGYFGSLRNIVSSIDKNLPVAELRTMAEVRNDYTVRPRFYVALLGGLAALGALLAATGIYGVLSHTVSQRRHEIGIRRALGAQDKDILRLVIRQGLTLAALGVAAGLAGALALTRLMRGWLYEVSATDPSTFIVVAGLSLLVALGACYAPARRATKVDPLTALRHA